MSIIEKYNKIFDFKKNFNFQYFTDVNLDTFNDKFTELMPLELFEYPNSIMVNDTDKEFFRKSLFIYALLKSYDILYTNDDVETIELQDNGLLNTTSANSSYTLISYKKHNKFVKIVPYDYIYNDSIIFDIINGFICNMIKNKYSMYTNHLATYEYSFLSYYINDNDKQYWNYNELINKDNIKSPYNIDNITKLNNEDYFKKSYITIFEAIHHIDLNTLFYISDDKSNIYYIEKILTNEFIDFFNFIINIGIEYGFKHNDIHFSNIIYNITTDKIVLIDFGKSIFAKYLNVDLSEDENIELNNINNFLLCELEKLNLKTSSKFSSYFVNVDNYKSLIENSNNLFSDKYKISYDDKKYPMIIFDLISICINLYLSLLKYLFLKYSDTDNKKEEINKLERIFGTIINFYNKDNHFIIKHDNTAAKLQNNYKFIILNYFRSITDKTILYPYKNTLKLILDSLFLINLLYTLNGIKENNGETIFLSPNFIFNIDYNKKRDMIQKLIEYYNENKEFFEINNIYLYNIMEGINIKGGYKNKRKIKKGGYNNIQLSELNNDYKNRLYINNVGFNKNKNKYIRKLKKY